MPSPSGAPTRTVPVTDTGLGDERRGGVHHLRFHPLGHGQQPLPGAGQRGSGRPTVEQHRAEGGLQGVKFSRHRRMVEAELTPGSEQLAAAGDREEDTQVVPVHAGSSRYKFRTTGSRKCALMCVHESAIEM